GRYFGSRRITWDGSRRALGSDPGADGRLSFTAWNLRRRRFASRQPAEMTRRKRVADVGDRVDDPARDDQRPQPAGASPYVGEHEAHDDIAEPCAEALVKVVCAAQEAGRQHGGHGIDSQLT